LIYSKINPLIGPKADLWEGRKAGRYCQERIGTRFARPATGRNLQPIYLWFRSFNHSFAQPMLHSVTPSTHVIALIEVIITRVTLVKLPIT